MSTAENFSCPHTDLPVLLKVDEKGEAVLRRPCPDCRKHYPLSRPRLACVNQQSESVSVCSEYQPPLYLSPEKLEQLRSWLRT